MKITPTNTDPRADTRLSNTTAISTTSTTVTLIAFTAITTTNATFLILSTPTMAIPTLTAVGIRLSLTTITSTTFMMGIVTQSTRGTGTSTRFLSALMDSDSALGGSPMMKVGPLAY